MPRPYPLAASMCQPSSRTRSAFPAVWLVPAAATAETESSAQRRLRPDVTDILTLRTDPISLQPRYTALPGRRRRNVDSAPIRCAQPGANAVGATIESGPPIEAGIHPMQATNPAAQAAINAALGLGDRRDFLAWVCIIGSLVDCACLNGRHRGSGALKNARYAPLISTRLMVLGSVRQGIDLRRHGVFAAAIELFPHQRNEFWGSLREPSVR